MMPRRRRVALTQLLDQRPWGSVITTWKQCPSKPPSLPLPFRPSARARLDPSLDLTAVLHSPDRTLTASPPSSASTLPSLASRYDGCSQVVHEVMMTCHLRIPASITLTKPLPYRPP